MVIVNCMECDVEFNKKNSEIRRSNNHFCTHSCSASFNNKGVQRNKPKDKTCKDCGIIYQGSRSIFCNKCKHDVAHYKN